MLETSLNLETKSFQSSTTICHISIHSAHDPQMAILTEWRQNTLKPITFNADQGSEVQIEFGSAIAL